MNYRLDGSVLVTDQSSQPGEGRTVFSITPEGKLVLEFGGIKSRYVRSSARGERVSKSRHFRAIMRLTNYQINSTTN